MDNPPAIPATMATSQEAQGSGKQCERKCDAEFADNE